MSACSAASAVAGLPLLLEHRHHAVEDPAGQRVVVLGRLAVDGEGGLGRIEARAELRLEADGELVQRLLLRISLLGPVGVQQAHDGVLDHLDDFLVDVFAAQHRAPPGVEGLALLVHHVVVVEQVLADVEVARLDLGLGVLDHAREQAVLDGLPFLDADAVPPLGHAFGLEDPQQVVFEGEEELARAGVALTARAAAELVVDAPALVALRPEDVQSAGGDDLLPLRARTGPRTPPIAAGTRGGSCRGRTSPGRGTPGCLPARCRSRARPCWSRS